MQVVRTSRRIQDWIERVAHVPVDGTESVPDVCVIELGGTVGDIESMPFIEALRQFQFRVGTDNFCLIPSLSCPSSAPWANRKPSRRNTRFKHFVPLVVPAHARVPIEAPARAERHGQARPVLSRRPKCIINLCDVSNIWHVPLVMLEQDALRNIMKQLQIPYQAPDLERWAYRATKWDNVTTPVTIALVGKYTGLGDSYLSVTKALLHSSIACDRKLDLLWIEASDLEKRPSKKTPKSTKRPGRP